MDWPWQKTANDSKDAWLREATLAIEQALGQTAGTTGAPIRPEAFLGADLGLTSLAVARLAGILRKRHARTPLPFPALFVKADGTLIRDIRVSDLAVFLEKHLKAAGP